MKVFLFEKFTFRVTNWDESDIEKELLGSSGVNGSSLGDKSALGTLSIIIGISVDERDKSSEPVSAKVT